MPQNTAPTSKKFSWAGGALCEPGPAWGLSASTLAHAVPVCAGATGLGFGAAPAGTAGIQIVLTAIARATAVPVLLIIFVTSFVGELLGRGGTLGRGAVGRIGAGPGSGRGLSLVPLRPGRGHHVGHGHGGGSVPARSGGRAGGPSGDRGAGECDRGSGWGGVCAVDRGAGAAWVAAAPAGSGDPHRGRRCVHRHRCGGAVAPAGQRDRAADGCDRVLVA